jgi:thiamine biosynthesis lipoprotein
MGTFAEVALDADLDADVLARLSQHVYAELERLDAKYSFHRQDSQLSEINRCAVRAKPIELDRETAALLGAALRFSRDSDGLFDICMAPQSVRHGALPRHILPPESPGDWRDLHLDGTQLAFSQPVLLDLGGIAKGYAVDQGLGQVPEGVDVTINLGGDVRMRCWRNQTIALRAPQGRAHAVEPMRAAAVASSIGAAGDHLGLLIDPRSGGPSADRRSYSVFADTALQADALTKLAMLADDRQLLWRAGARALVRIDAEGHIERWFAPQREDATASGEPLVPCR